MLPDLETLYMDIHSHPELSMQEKRTAALAADRLRAAGFEVTTGVGGTGVVGVLRNGMARETGAAPASEDFGSFGTDWHVPSVFWFVGGTDPDLYAKAKAANRLNELPVNHSPKFAPVLHPTLRMGVETLVVAARTWMPA